MSAVISETEARSKFCFRAATFGASQQIAEGPGPHCIASACMAWRAMETVAFQIRAEAEFKQTGARLRSDTGFCGLAGEP